MRIGKAYLYLHRNFPSLLEKINYVIDNYNSIQESMKNNILPNNENFIKGMKEILSKKLKSSYKEIEINYSIR